MYHLSVLSRYITRCHPSDPKPLTSVENAQAEKISLCEDPGWGKDAFGPTYPHATRKHFSSCQVGVELDAAPVLLERVTGVMQNRSGQRFHLTGYEHRLMQIGSPPSAAPSIKEPKLV